MICAGIQPRRNTSTLIGSLHRCARCGKAPRDAFRGVPLAAPGKDNWTEVVPHPPGPQGPEEVVGVAFELDRPGARPPQSLLVAVPPDRSRGWCMEDLHACVESALALAVVRTLDLSDLPALRGVLPIPDGRG